MSEALIELHDVTSTYPGATDPVFQGLSYELPKRMQIGLIGPNGCGKTTLLHLIMGLLRPQEGSMVIFGQQVKREKDFVKVRQKVGLLFQNADDQLFCPTVLEDVAFGPLNKGKPPTQAIRIARETMARLGLEGFEDRVTYKLSGGEKKLVSLATVLAMHPEVLLLDEPTAGLDEKTKERLVSILKNLDITFMVVSHETDFLEHTVGECCHVHSSFCEFISMDKWRELR